MPEGVSSRPDPISGSEGAPPRWLVDEMLGRLARYLRFFGQDTVYARGLEDSRIRELAISEGRILITRDRALALRTDGAILLHTTEIRGQLREVVSARPSVRFELRFDRCPECNGGLDQFAPGTRPTPPHPVNGPTYRCPECDRWFWDGSHTERIRTFVRDALSIPPEVH